MKKYLLILGTIFCFTAGLAISEENQQTEPVQQSESKTDKTESKKNCKKVCVKRDGYGMCTEFEQRCKEN